MLNIYFFFFININFKPFFKYGRKYLFATNSIIYLFFWNYIIKNKFKTSNIKINIKLKKKFSRNYIVLKAAFKHKIPKHVLKQQQSKLILKISIPYSINNFKTTSNLSNFVDKIISLPFSGQNILFLPSQLYRVKYESILKLDLNNFLNNF